MKKKLKLGLLLDSLNIPAWKYAVLERLQQEGYSEFRLVVLNEAFGMEKNTGNWLYKKFLTFEKKQFKVQPDAFENVDANLLLVNIPVLKVRPNSSKSAHRLMEEDVTNIRENNLDILIQLGFKNLQGEILSAARFGVWSIHHGDIQMYGSFPEGIWEVLERQPVTGSILHILGNNLNGRKIISKSYSHTDQNSVWRNRNCNHWKSVALLPRAIKLLSEQGEEYFLESLETQNKHLNFFFNKRYPLPTNRNIIKPLSKHLWKIFLITIEKSLFFNQWMLMYDLCDEVSSNFRDFKSIYPPKDRAWADPFIIFKDDKHYIFIEELFYHNKRAHISVMIMDHEGNFENPVKILERPYHLSYPFLFEWEGYYYMIPETSGNKTIELYKCTEFPYQWEFQKNIMEDVIAADSTILCHDSKYWLFVNMKENEGYPNWDELFLFYSDNPISGKWHAHPQNPIVSDVRSARPAGNIYVRNDCIYRPSQNSAFRYGYGLKINQILTITEQAYEEVEVSSIEPHWQPKLRAVHTLNHAGRLTLIDVNIKRSK